jgi:galactokinase
VADKWARFPYGVDFILRREGLAINYGLDGVIFGNIPGGGMSRSASLTINLLLSLLDVNQIEIDDPFQIVEMAQAVENDYIGSPCGQLDQIMILFARPEAGVHFHPREKKINYIPLGKGGEKLRLVVLDTGTERPGLEKSTYRLRRAECTELVARLQKDGYQVNYLADIKDEELYQEIMARYQTAYPHLCRRLKYIYEAQQRFSLMLAAWRQGDIQTVGRVFRQDGLGLRDDYQISGPELETMCDLARSIPGVLGERMLGGGDKGAAGALVLDESVEALKKAIAIGYPRSHPHYGDRYAVHVCRVVGGVSVLEERV